MHARPNFEAFDGGSRAVDTVLGKADIRRGSTVAGRHGLRDIVDAEFLVLAAGGHAGWRSLLWKGDGFDDVGVLESVEAFAGVWIPDLPGDSSAERIKNLRDEVFSRREIG